MAAADALYEVMTLMVKKGPLSLMTEKLREGEEDGKNKNRLAGLKMW